MTYFFVQSLFFVAAKLFCPALDCSYKCQASPTGGSCYCPDGKQLASDDRTCIDRDECSEWGFCDQLCTNTAESYSCSCASGFKLKDKNRCVADNSSAMNLYFAHENAIFSIDPTGNNKKTIVNTTGASGLDFSFAKNMLYWSDVKTKRVGENLSFSK